MDRSIPVLNIFDPVSTPAQAILEHSWLVLWICAGIFVIVSGLLVYTLIRFRRRRADDDEPPQVYGSNQIELAWTVIPLLTVFVLFLVTTRTIKAVQQAVPSAEALLVTIIGHQWWWEMRYPALGIVTANAWHVPVSAQTQPMPTFLKLQSVDVAHIPSLKAKELSKLPREEAGVWSSGKDRIPRIPLSALRPGEAPGGHALPVVAVLAVRQSLRRHLGSVRPSMQG